MNTAKLDIEMDVADNAHLVRYGSLRLVVDDDGRLYALCVVSDGSHVTMPDNDRLRHAR